jgi:hypothetical protein
VFVTVLLVTLNYKHQLLLYVSVTKDCCVISKIWGDNKMHLYELKSCPIIMSAMNAC